MNTNNSNFFLMRHGETDTNRLHIWQCSMDEPLNQNGRQQALEVSPIIEDINPDIVVTSTLRRAKETARIAAVSLDSAEFIVEKDLRERSCGAAEGLTSEEILDRFGIKMEMTSTAMDIVPGAEPYDLFASRVVSALERLYDNYPGTKILIVSHGGVMRTFYNNSIGPVPPGIVFRNCSILSLKKDNGAWRILDKHNTAQI